MYTPSVACIRACCPLCQSIAGPLIFVPGDNGPSWILQAFKDYDLEQHKIFNEEHYKSRAIIAHGTASRTILVAFRGTSSIRNLHLDLRGWPTVWPRHRWRPSPPPQPPQWLPHPSSAVNHWHRVPAKHLCFDFVAGDALWS